MKRPVSLIEALIAFLLAVVVPVTTGYLSLRDSQKTTAVKIQMLESNFSELRDNIKTSDEVTNRKLDAITVSLYEIRVLMERKQDRK